MAAQDELWNEMRAFIDKPGRAGELLDGLRLLIEFPGIDSFHTVRHCVSDSESELPEYPVPPLPRATNSRLQPPPVPMIKKEGRMMSSLPSVTNSHLQPPEVTELPVPMINSRHKRQKKARMESRWNRLVFAIQQESANIQVQKSKIEELVGSMVTSEANLKLAAKIRAQEQATFEIEEKDLVELVELLDLGRRISIMDKETVVGTSMMQLKKGRSLTEVLCWMVQAKFLSGADEHRLSALIPFSNDEAKRAPGSAENENNDCSINDLLEQSQTLLKASRATEKAHIHNYETLKHSLIDEIKLANHKMDEAKTSKAKSEEAKGIAEADLEATSNFPR